MEFRQKLQEGLEAVGITMEEIRSGDWKYAGGDGGHMVWDNGNGYRERDPCNRHYRYFTIAHRDYDFLEYDPKCKCNQDIVENCYIYNKKKEQFCVLGNCCIKRFMREEDSGRSCGKCGKRHQNRKDNLCDECRKEASMKRCSDCTMPHKNRTDNMCNTCRFELKDHPYTYKARGRPWY